MLFLNPPPLAASPTPSPSTCIGLPDHAVEILPLLVGVWKAVSLSTFIGVNALAASGVNSGLRSSSVILETRALQHHGILMDWIRDLSNAMSNPLVLVARRVVLSNDLMVQQSVSEQRFPCCFCRLKLHVEKAPRETRREADLQIPWDILNGLRPSANVV